MCERGELSPAEYLAFCQTPQGRKPRDLKPVEPKPPLKAAE